MGNLAHQVSFKVDEETHRLLVETAHENNETIGSAARRLLQKGLHPDNAPTSSPSERRQRRNHDHIRNQNDELIWDTAQRVAAIQKDLQYVAMTVADAQVQQQDRANAHEAMLQSLLSLVGELPNGQVIEPVRTEIKDLSNGIQSEFHRIHQDIESLLARLEGEVAESLSIDPRPAIAAMRNDWIKSFGVILQMKLGFSREEVKQWMAARIKESEGAVAW